MVVDDTAFTIRNVAKPSIYQLWLDEVVDGQSLYSNNHVSVLVAGPPDPPVLQLDDKGKDGVVLKWDAVTSYPPYIVSGFQLFANGQKVCFFLIIE